MILVARLENRCENGAVNQKYTDATTTCITLEREVLKGAKVLAKAKKSSVAFEINRLLKTWIEIENREPCRELHSNDAIPEEELRRVERNFLKANKVSRK